MPIDPQFTFERAVHELILRFGKRADNNFHQRVTDWLNSAQYRIAVSLVEVPDLEDQLELPITEDVQEYDLRTTSPPITDIVGIKWVKNNATGYRMRRFPYGEYQQLVNQAVAPPMRWARNGYKLALDPIPDSSDFTITVRFRRMPRYGALEVGDQWQDLCMKLAVSLGWSSLMEHERARELLAELPAVLQLATNSPIDQAQWEAAWDPDLGIRPMSYGY